MNASLPAIWPCKSPCCTTFVMATVLSIAYSRSNSLEGQPAESGSGVCDRQASDWAVPRSPEQSTSSDRLRVAGEQQGRGRQLLAVQLAP